MATFGAAVLAVVGVFVLLAALACMNGYALSVLWAWFIVPTFGLPSLSVPTAIGILLVSALLAKKTNPSRKKKDAFGDFFTLFLVAPMALLIGWIVKLFM